MFPFGDDADLYREKRRRPGKRGKRVCGTSRAASRLETQSITLRTSETVPTSVFLFASAESYGFTATSAIYLPAALLTESGASIYQQHC